MARQRLLGRSNMALKLGEASCPSLPGAYPVTTRPTAPLRARGLENPVSAISIPMQLDSAVLGRGTETQLSLENRPSRSSSSLVSRLSAT